MALTSHNEEIGHSSDHTSSIESVDSLLKLRGTSSSSSLTKDLRETVFSGPSKTSRINDTPRNSPLLISVKSSFFSHRNQLLFLRHRRKQSTNTERVSKETVRTKSKSKSLPVKRLFFDCVVPPPLKFPRELYRSWDEAHSSSQKEKARKTKAKQTPKVAKDTHDEPSREVIIVASSPSVSGSPVAGPSTLTTTGFDNDDNDDDEEHEVVKVKGKGRNSHRPIVIDSDSDEYRQPERAALSSKTDTKSKARRKRVGERAKVKRADQVSKNWSDFPSEGEIIVAQRTNTHAQAPLPPLSPPNPSVADGQEKATIVAVNKPSIITSTPTWTSPADKPSARKVNSALSAEQRPNKHSSDVFYSVPFNCRSPPTVFFLPPIFSCTS
ncbi:hypothetical protein DFH11DRAFT_363924 [Phellopilus nigrolimitatus]|nr:hypothetical protein DFH11DRAFT_363924 [Phellopilus nigrolimitatus]